MRLVRVRSALLLGTLCAALSAQESSPLAEAEKLLAQQKYPAAAAALAEILKSDPGNARAHGNLALALLGQGKTREAVDEGRLAAAFGPDLPEARYIYGMTLQAAGRHREAARELERAVAARPEAAAPRRALADAYAATGDPRAADIYRKLIVLEPETLSHRTELAEHLWGVGKSDDGNRVLEETLVAFPSSADLQFRYGRALVRQYRYLDGAARLEQARTLGESGDTFAVLLATAYRQADRAEEAERVLTGAALAYPTSPEVLAELGRLLLTAGRAAEALPRLQAAAALNPGSAALQLDLGRADESLGKLDEAEAAYRAAIRLAPKLPRAHYALGHLLLRRGQRAEAEAELALHREAYDQRVKATTANDALTAELALGYTRLKAGDAPGALEIFTRLPESADTLVASAEALARLGRHAEAVRALERARTLDPDNPRVDSLLAAERSHAAAPK
jgi:Flp pilus assembly protein TadD